MPPRIPIASRSAASSSSVSTFAERKAHKDPYALAQSAQRKAVNLARQKVLQAERKQALGDPVRGITTPFVQSFDSVGGSAKVKAVEKDGVVVGLEPTIETDASLGYFLTPEELKKSLDHSYSLAEPFNLTSIQDPVERREIRTKYEDGHQRATVALTRITPRAGPDTGSSEVQIAILTAKIKVLADQLEKKGGNKDKVNKRNLRIMVHKRQKHLNYLRRKERGSDRWQNLISTLGLTEGTYKGEISL
ncbi:putative 30S ribosomal protein S15 [Glarea lozoyensis 74030]|uniref:Putative 30S ribosomal protein S15 n=1 Tax=Glarea lozoyensis (strain ATCC 74030 / MF5533) TaxID=1104152 RepID=H0EP60_GLAL7|nr:putative 30S ribosomal protein S15 [Glarea lozoyensis 74030]